MRTLRRNILQFPGKPKKLFVRYRKRTYTIVHSKDIFKISLIVIVLTILAVYFWGLGAHHTFYQNSIISTTVLSCAFFTFVTIGLYNGIKLKDNLGNVVDQYKPVGISDTFELGRVDAIDGIDGGEGCLGVIISIILWIVAAILLAIALWIFSNVVLIMVLGFIGMLYWIFLRALRLVFKNSNRSKGDLFESFKWGFTYTVLYNFWIYGIFILINYLKQ
jgi:hypothetical protein